MKLFIVSISLFMLVFSSFNIYADKSVDDLQKRIVQIESENNKMAARLDDIIKSVDHTLEKSSYTLSFVTWSIGLLSLFIAIISLALVSLQVRAREIFYNQIRSKIFNSIINDKKIRTTIINKVSKAVEISINDLIETLKKFDETFSKHLGIISNIDYRKFKSFNEGVKKSRMKNKTELEQHE